MLSLCTKVLSYGVTETGFKTRVHNFLKFHKSPSSKLKFHLLYRPFPTESQVISKLLNKIVCIINWQL